MRPAPFLALALIAVLPSASADRFGDGCSDLEGDAGGNAWIDITGIRTAVEDGVVTVRVTYADSPGAYMATHSLTVDFEGNDDPDLSYLDDGGGSFRGAPVYWSAYPVAEGNDIVYPLKTDGVDAAALEGSKWTVAAGAFTSGGSDNATCASNASAIPGAGLAAVLAVAGALAAIMRR